MTFIILIIISLLTISSAQANPDQELEQIIVNLKAEYKIPGAVVGIIEQGQITYLNAWGYQDLENNIVMKPDTVFQLASISKPITALGIFKLIEEDFLELHAPITPYIKSWDYQAQGLDLQNVTIAHLLSHTSGLGPGGYLGYNPQWGQPSLTQALSGSFRNSRTIVKWDEPGKRFAYSGGGYTILQLIVEEITHKPFAAVLDELIFAPLELTQTSFQPSSEILAATARGYSVYGNPFPNYLFTEKAAAGLYSTPQDMLTLIEFIINDYQEQQEFLSLAAYQAMFTPHLNDYALGWEIISIDENIFFAGHGGANRGWKCYFTMNPPQGSAIVIFVNSDRGMPFYQAIANTWFNSKNIDHQLEEVSMPLIYLFDLYQRLGSFYYRIVDFFRSP